MDEPAGEGTCQTCGFLWRRDTRNLNHVDYFPISERDREARHWLPPREEYLAPWCFRNVPIHREIMQLAGVTVLGDLSPGILPPTVRQDQIHRLKDAATDVLTRDRRCPLWIEYQAGLGPQDHLAGKAMRDMEAGRRTFLDSLEQQRQGFEREMEAGRRAHQEDLEAQRRAFEREMAASRDTFTLNLAEAGDRFQRSTRTITIWLTIAAIILAVAQVVAAVAALTCESLLWIWLGWIGSGCSPQH